MGLVSGAVTGVRVGDAVTGMRVDGVVAGVRAGGAVTGVRVGDAVTGVRVGGAVTGVRVGDAVTGVRVGGVIAGVRAGGAVRGGASGWGCCLAATGRHRPPQAASNNTIASVANRRKRGLAATLATMFVIRSTRLPVEAISRQGPSRTRSELQVLGSAAKFYRRPHISANPRQFHFSRGIPGDLTPRRRKKGQRLNRCPQSQDLIDEKGQTRPARGPPP